MQSPRDLRLGVPTAQGTCITCPLALVRDSRPHWQGRTWHPVPKLVLCSIRRADRVGAEKEETGFRRWPERQLEMVGGCGQTSCRLHLHSSSWGLRPAVRTHPAASQRAPSAGGATLRQGTVTHTHPPQPPPVGPMQAVCFTFIPKLLQGVKLSPGPHGGDR